MPYIRETCVAGKTIEVCKYFTFRTHTKGEKREPKEKPTSESQKKVNQRKAEKELRRLMNENFKDGDLLVRLDFSKLDYKTLNSEAMQQLVAKFIRKLRYELKKQGIELKYIYVKEIGKRGGRHVHALINKIDTDLIMKCWKHGGVHLDPLYSDGQYAKIASYFIKYAAKTEDTEGELVGKRYYASRNLKKPVAKKQIISSLAFRHRPRPKAGYYVDKESIEEGISETTGYEYYSCTYIRADKLGGGGKKRRKT